MVTVTIEAHELDTRTGLYCCACRSHDVTEVDIALVAADNLRVLGHFTGSACGVCGAHEVTR